MKSPQDTLQRPAPSNPETAAAVTQQQVQAKVIAVPLPLANAVVNFLSAQPYNQVAGLIAELQQCQPFDIVENVP
ncbi:hypothetical protein [Stenotrophomonas sp. SORGH_AS_0282]|uniref:hypothetical protein n=1 Tax=Stenotrophomonas sp. SORGH_AS_0282 TaxID=3041763 RepID=UPI0027871181|nr:hypothetical protein [Stenotrophomonas sp. SORGH_AS_0282]MDQ1062382.1 hypothetical protein [Stenotrophomonas sp. SORGH_AS_0282]MDQ1189261.1 hypothetical protein [Stenotrophomonas sp. SORGH_AS_0282]